MTETFSISKRHATSVILLVLISSFFMSYKDKEVNGNSLDNQALNKEERLDLFLESPITVNTKLNEQRLNAIKFHKSYILNKNPHVDADGDSLLKANSNSFVVIGKGDFDNGRDFLIRLPSDTDIIEILKNKYVERITYMRLQSEDLQLNYGVRLGMDLDSFTKLLPLKVDANHEATYRDNDAFELKFVFDPNDKTLQEVY